MLPGRADAGVAQKAGANARARTAAQIRNCMIPLHKFHY
jgi:hypothetical protein